jgi:hypothetical protein
MTAHRNAIAGELEKGMAETVSLFKSLSPENLRMKLYQDGAQWTVQQVLTHFIAIERSMQWLFKDILAAGRGSPVAPHAGVLIETDRRLPLIPNISQTSTTIATDGASTARSLHGA